MVDVTASSTRVRHVPQNPCWHEYGAVTLDAPQRRQQRLVGADPDRRCPVEAIDTVNSLPSTTGGAANRSKCSSTSSRPTSPLRIAVNIGAGPHA